MASPGTPPARSQQLDCFLHTTLRVKHNGTELSVLSMLARAGLDPWTEAARLASLPRDKAADRLAATIAGLLAGTLPPAYARMVAHCLVPVLPDPANPLLNALVADGRFGRCIRNMLLAGAMLSAALALGLQAGAAFWANSHAGPADASAGAAGTSRPSAVGQPDHHGVNAGRPAQVRPAVVRAA